MSQAAGSNRLLVAKPTSSRIIAWLCIALFSFGAVMSWRAGEREVALLFLVFVALGFVILAFSGSVEMNQEFILYKSPWANYELRWDEVKRIEVDVQGGAMVFIGGDKRLAAPGPGYWSGKDKLGMLSLVASKIKEGGIPVEQTRRAMFRQSKKTKVR